MPPPALRVQAAQESGIGSRDQRRRPLRHQLRHRFDEMPLRQACRPSRQLFLQPGVDVFQLFTPVADKPSDIDARQAVRMTEAGDLVDKLHPAVAAAGLQDPSDQFAQIAAGDHLLQPLPAGGIAVPVQLLVEPAAGETVEAAGLGVVGHHPVRLAVPGLWFIIGSVVAGAAYRPQIGVRAQISRRQQGRRRIVEHRDGTDRCGLLAGQFFRQQVVDILSGQSGHLDFLGPAQKTGPTESRLAAGVGKGMSQETLLPAGDCGNLPGDKGKQVPDVGVGASVVVAGVGIL